MKSLLSQSRINLNENLIDFTIKNKKNKRITKILILTNQKINK
jgi:hypothetical protein